MRTTAGRSKAGLLAAFFAGCATASRRRAPALPALREACFRRGPCLPSPRSSPPLPRRASPCPGRRGGRGAAACRRSARRRPARPRKASTAQVPRDFNPRQAAVDELARAHSLTPREKEVLEFMAHGRDVQFISESLCFRPTRCAPTCTAFSARWACTAGRSSSTRWSVRATPAFSNTAARPARRRARRCRRRGGRTARRRAGAQRSRSSLSPS